MLGHVNTFLTETTHEIVILDFQHLFNFNSESDWDGLINFLADEISLPAIEDPLCTLSELWNKGQRLLIVAGKQEMAAAALRVDRTKVHHRGEVIESKYHAKQTPSTLHDALQNAGVAGDERIRVMQAVLTPNCWVTTKLWFCKFSFCVETCRRCLPNIIYTCVYCVLPV